MSSPSSMALSLMESELVETLARRIKAAEVLVGEVPGRPKVATETLRRWLSSMDVAKGVGKPVTEGCEMELLRKRLVRVLEVTDPRLCCRAISLLELLEDELSEDMMKEGGLEEPEDARTYIEGDESVRLTSSCEAARMAFQEGGSGFGKIGSRVEV